MKHIHTNHLINETSPYLLQHAHNPVQWYPWGEEALQKAKNENKPILVSIGYSACHWCHVMERESFEDEYTAEIMNKYFVNIKIDREERPDLDHIYMDAVQAISGSGGWPLNVFLTPGTKPFHGGTYFPPVRSFGRMSWQETLLAVHEAFKERSAEIMTQAEKLTAHLQNANAFGNAKKTTAWMQETTLQQIADNITAAADAEWGGFGKAPKFPQTFTIQNLLRHYHYTNDETALKQALLSLNKMIQGGIYDHIGGGFARYSTDEKWLAPHFEKMLYDNALLITVLAEAFQITGEEQYKKIMAETIDFIERELTHAEGGCLSALDADSEGVEGKFYTWSKKETDALLTADAAWFCKMYDISEHGNWEHTNILWLKKSLKEFANESEISAVELEANCERCKALLFEKRKERIRPATDDKILLGWNALMITALCKAGGATANGHYILSAERKIKFLEENLYSEKKGWQHTWKNEEAKYPAFLDDLAYLMQAYIQLQETTGKSDYLLKAKTLAGFVLQNFSDDETPFLFFTHQDQNDVIIRKKEVYDGAVPSGNAVMAHNLLYLSVVFDIPAWKEKAYNMTDNLGNAIVRYPTSFGVWASLMQILIKGINEIAVTGVDEEAIRKEILKNYIPAKILQSSTKEDSSFPLLSGKNTAEKAALIYLCKDYSCRQPVATVHELLEMINKA